LTAANRYPAAATEVQEMASPVADQVNPPVGRDGGAVHGDAAQLALQPQRRQVADRRAEAGGPQDHVGRLERAVGHADAVGLDRGEHRLPGQGSAPGGARGVGGRGQAGIGDDGADGPAGPRVRLDPGDRRPADGLRGEVTLDPGRLAAGDPRRGRHLRDLVKELDGGDAAADHDHVPAGEFRRADVPGRVQLPPGEGFKAGIPGPVRLGPRAGRVDDRPGGPGAVTGLHDQPAVPVASAGTVVSRAAGEQVVPGVAYRVHADGAQDREAELPLVGGEVARHGVGRRLGGVKGRFREAGQVEDAVDRRHPQGPPAVPPGAAGPVLAVEHHVLQAEPPQVIGGGEPGLAGADDHHGRRAGGRGRGKQGTRAEAGGFCCHVM
jgi:hypothetical protein